MRKTQIAGLVAAAALGGFAVYGGEYSTRDWWTLRQRLGAERDTVRQLEAQLDSLARYTRAIENDPAAQERAAREQFGMIRDGEILYRLVPRDH